MNVVQPHPFLRLVDTLQATALPPVHLEVQVDPHHRGRTAYRISAYGIGARAAIQNEIARLSALAEDAPQGGFANFTRPGRIDGDGFGALGEVVLNQGGEK